MMTAMNTSDDNSNAKGDSITAMIIMSHFKMMKSDFRSAITCRCLKRNITMPTLMITVKMVSDTVDTLHGVKNSVAGIVGIGPNTDAMPNVIM